MMQNTIISHTNVHILEGWGWIEDSEHGLVLVWATFSEAARACSKLHNPAEAQTASQLLFCTDLVFVNVKFRILVMCSMVSKLSNTNLCSYL